MIDQEKISLMSETRQAIKAAKKAGEEVLKIYKEDFDFILKEDKEPVTDADIRSNKMIEKILSVFNYPILSEESRDDLNRLKQKKVWIIDPLDGTIEFVNKTGEFSIMIALVENHTPKACVIYQPTQKLMYLAEKGKGAYQEKDGAWEKLKVNPSYNISSIKAITSRADLSEQEKQEAVVVG